MAFEHKTNTGSLFKNDKRITDNHPNATGSGKFACPGCGQETELDIAAWTKDGSKGKFQSLSIKPKQQSSGQTESHSADDDQDVPF